MNKEERKQLCLSIMADNVSNVILDNDIKRLRNGCFMECENLQTITLPNSIIKLGDSCFQQCTGLKSVLFEEPCQITVLPPLCFSFNTHLTSIEIPHSITCIDRYCFKRQL